MRVKAFNIALPKDLVEKIDKAAKKEYRNRSELIRQAVWVYLKDREEWEKLFDYGKRIGKKMGIKSEEDVNRIVYQYRHGRKSGKSRS